MTSDSPARDFLLPRLSTLLDDAVAQGFARDVVVAVLIDVVTSPRFDTAAPDPLADSAPHPDYIRGADPVVLVGGQAAHQPPPFDAHDEANFVQPFGVMSPS